MVDSQIKRMRCPNPLCLGVADQCGHNEYWCKLCGSRWFIREMNIYTKTKKAPFQSGVPSDEYRHEYPDFSIRKKQLRRR